MDTNGLKSMLSEVEGNLRPIRIDRENNALEERNHGGHNVGNRVTIPQEEMDELRAFRRAKHIRQARKVHNDRLLEIALDESRYRSSPNLILGGADENRPYGLPPGKEHPSHIWEKIFDHVHDVEDIMNLRDTCILFWDLLEMKYKSLRMAEVFLKLGHRLGARRTLRTLRLVCKSTKAVIDQWILNDRPDISWCREEIPLVDFKNCDWIEKPKLYFPHFRYLLNRRVDKEEMLRTLQAILTSFESRQVPTSTFPITKVCLLECALERSANDVVLLDDLWSLFRRFLELVGNKVMVFAYAPFRDDVDSYNRLRTWVTLMPNLVELILQVQGENANLPEMPLQLQPFPFCPKLKRVANEGVGMRSVFTEQVFLANPGVDSVLLSLHPRNPPEDEEILKVQESLANLQLERFHIEGDTAIPREQLLHLRFSWPLKILMLTHLSYEDEHGHEGISSRNLFKFINSFSPTLEELTVIWKLRDTGGFLDMPKLRKLMWTLWSGFRTMDFMLPLAGLEHLDLDVIPFSEINEDFEKVKIFVNEMNLSHIFPALRRIRTRTQYLCKWIHVWPA